MKYIFQDYQNNSPLKHRLEIVENKLFAKTRHNPFSPCGRNS